MCPRFQTFLSVLGSWPSTFTGQKKQLWVPTSRGIIERALVWRYDYSLGEEDHCLIPDLFVKLNHLHASPRFIHSSRLQVHFCIQQIHAPNTTSWRLFSGKSHHPKKKSKKKNPFWGSVRWIRPFGVGIDQLNELLIFYVSSSLFSVFNSLRPEAFNRPLKSLIGRPGSQSRISM